MMLHLPYRENKPRENGLTMVIDTGYPLGLVRDYLELGADLIDYVKLGWGTALVTKELETKLALYREFHIPLSFGGTLFELALIQDRVAQFESFLLQNGVEYVEISDGTVSMSLEEKLEYIAYFAKRGFKVLSEVGSKDTKAVVAPKKWVKETKSALDAGAWKVIAEGRESGKAGLYRESSEIRTGLIEELLDEVPLEDLIFEAPQKAQQVWFITEFGSNVNLGNIAFGDIIALETLRLGLRGDTLKHFHAKREAEV